MNVTSDKWTKIILIITTLILIGFEVHHISINSHYKWDFIFLILGLYALFFLRKKINLHPFHYFLVAGFLILHNFGNETFDFYSLYPLGIEYDFWLHGYFGFIASLILYRSLTRYKIKPRYFIVSVILVTILGLSAFHELVEFAGEVTLGKGGGIFFIGPGDLDEWDTQKDMLNNLIGAIIGLTLYINWNLIKGRKPI